MEEVQSQKESEEPSKVEGVFVTMKRMADGRFKRYFRVTKERSRFLAEHEELACLQPKRSDGIQLEVQLA